MSNMSYCRFQNTATDLGDCKLALEALLSGEGYDGDEPTVLSHEELRAAKRLVKMALGIVLAVDEVAELGLEELDLGGAEERIDGALSRSNEEANSRRERRRATEETR